MRRLAAIAAAVLVLTVASACGGNDANSGDTSSNGTTQSAGNGPDQSDSRKLADWAALQMAKGNTTAICKYAADKGQIQNYFGARGWCTKPPQVTPAIPTQIQLKGTCTNNNPVDPANTAAGDLYFYMLNPTAQYNADQGKVNQVVVVVHKETGKYLISGLYVQSQDVVTDKGQPNFLDVNGCPDHQATAIDAPTIKVA